MSKQVTQFMTTAEVAEAFGKSIKTITRWVAADRITPIKRLPGPRGAFLFDPSDVEALLSREPWEPSR